MVSFLVDVFLVEVFVVFAVDVSTCCDCVCVCVSCVVVVLLAADEGLVFVLVFLVVARWAFFAVEGAGASCASC